VEDSDSPLPAIREGIVHLRAAANKSRETMSECRDAPTCPVDLGALVAPIDQLIEMVRDVAGQDDPGAEPYAALLESLEAARMHIEEAAALLEEHNAISDLDLALQMREQAIESVAAAGTVLNDAAGQAEAIEGDGGDGSEPDGGMVDDPDAEDEQPGEATEPQRGGGIRSGGLCGLGIVLLMACVPFLVVWKVCRKH
jgi:hypothetical protein